jgi:hypothetical protein
MFTKRILLLALALALFGTTAGCGWRRSCCRTEEPECRNYDPCR